MNLNVKDSRCPECGRRLNKPFDFELTKRECWCGAEIPEDIFLRFVVADIRDKLEILRKWSLSIKDRATTRDKGVERRTPARVPRNKRRNDGNNYVLPFEG